MSHRWILCWALTPLVALPAFAQSVISAHSGLVHYAVGSVFLDDQRVEQPAGKFEQMKNGSELRTEDGRAEVLLTPGVFLRLGSNSAIRMISNQLEDTRVELLTGSAMLNQGPDTLANTSVTVLYNLDQVRIQKQGRYRFDSHPPQLKVEAGEAEVLAGGDSVKAGAGDAVPFEGKLAARKLMGSTADALDIWNTEREGAVAENNLDASAAADLSGVIDGWQNNPDALLQSLGIPPYIPGMSATVPPLGYGSSVYGSGVYGSGVYGSGVYGSSLYGPGLYGSGLYGYGIGATPYGLWGLGSVSPLVVYPLPLYRSNRYPYSTPYSTLNRYGYRGPVGVTGRPGIGAGSGVYRGFGPIHSVGPVHPGVGVGRPGVGVGHVGGGHR
jgi:hypothetical protein